jgi:hypothetical protein
MSYNPSLDYAALMYNSHSEALKAKCYDSVIDQFKVKQSHDIVVVSAFIQLVEDPVLRPSSILAAPIAPLNNPSDLTGIAIIRQNWDTILSQVSAAFNFDFFIFNNLFVSTPLLILKALTLFLMTEKEFLPIHIPMVQSNSKMGVLVIFTIKNMINIKENLINFHAVRMQLTLLHSIPMTVFSLKQLQIELLVQVF